MPADMSNISLTLIYRGETYPVRTYTNEYYSLMTLISEHLAIAGFGLCSGMGSCGTCMVQMGNKYSSTTKHILACGTRVNDGLSNTQITIADQFY